jgi:GDP-4-dehydro-6-deoxy-D-mannose reductase
MKRRYLITGVCGFSGRHLAAWLRRRPAAVVLGSGRRPYPNVPLDGYRAADLTDGNAAGALAAWARPDVVFHLAALGAAASEARIRLVNVQGFLNLHAALRLHVAGRAIRLVTIGSAAELGSAGVARLPVTEASPCSPESAYGRSKWEITRRVLAEPSSGSLETVVARTFNLVGPGLDSRLALGNFARQLARIQRGETDALRCGPLEARRDFLDVRDAIAAYVALAERGSPGELYNVCSGQSHRIGDLLGQLIDLASVPVRVIPASGPRRPFDPPDVYGSHAKLTRATGWRPALGIRRSLADLLAAQQIGEESTGAFCA